ncbi:MAG: YdeI/OmpD-associated family protein [Actinomycetes bacterium]
MAAKRTAQETRDGLPVLPFASADDLESWLDAHQVDRGVWVKMAKRGSGLDSVTLSDALDVALCFGWIDGQRVSYDDTHFLQRYTPRRPRSRWSQINVGRVEALRAAGRMRPAGLAEVEKAKADGRWDAAYASPSTITVPDDLRAALDAEPAAAETFATLDSTNRYAVLYRVEGAKRPETRARRIATFVEMLARGETPHPRPERQTRRR